MCVRGRLPVRCPCHLVIVVVCDCGCGCDCDCDLGPFALLGPKRRFLCSSQPGTRRRCRIINLFPPHLGTLQNLPAPLCRHIWRTGSHFLAYFFPCLRTETAHIRNQDYARWGIGRASRPAIPMVMQSYDLGNGMTVPV